MAAALLLPAALAGIAAGILLEDALSPAHLPVPALLAAATLAGLTAGLRGCLQRPSPALVVVGVALAACSVGAWRGEGATLPTGPGSLSSLVGDQTWTVEGTIVDDPRPRGERQQAVIDDVLVGGDGDGAGNPARGRLLLWLPRSAVLVAGDRIEVEGRLAEPRDFDGFAYREYLARQGIGATASVRAVRVVGHALGPLVDAVGGLRRSLLAGLNSLVPEPEAALAAGILLGVRSAIAPEVSDAFASAGLTHVVAISGWNIAIVAALAAGLGRPLLRHPGGRYLAAIMAATSVTGYVLLTGASPSVVRAALMAAALVMARFGGSRAHAISALMAAALAMLLVAPPVLWDVGFQLSALATAGLIWFGAGIERRLRRWPGLVREPVALTLAAQLTTLPVIVLNFERLSLVAPLANVLVVPIVPIVMLVAALAAVAGTLQPVIPIAPLADLIGWAAGGGTWIYLRLMITIGQLAAAVPLASVPVTAPVWLAAAWYPALPLVRRRLAGATTETGPPATRVEAPMPALARFARPAPMAFATLAILAGLTLATQPDGRIHLAVLDIGQGDAILLRGASGRTLLVDGGPDPDLLVRRLGEELPFWQRSVDVVLLTHPHEDHVAGLVPVLERFRVTLVLDSGRPYGNPSYGRFLDAARAEPGARLLLAHAGLELALDTSTRIRVIFPDDRDLAAPLPEGDINNASVVVVADAAGRRVLLAGDAEAPVERLLLDRQLIGPVDILKVGHHGSDSSSTEAFLAAMMPSVALISAGIDNEYGHPHASTLAHLVAVPGLVVRRTDLEGTIRLDWGRHGGTPAPPPGTIAAWRFPPTRRRRRSWPATRCRRRSSSMRAAWHGLPRRPPAWWRQQGSRLTRTSSRSPPSSTTSTSSPRDGAESRTASSARAG